MFPELHALRECIEDWILIVVLRQGFTCVKDERRNVLQSYRTVQIVLKRKRAIKSQREESLIWGHNLLWTPLLGTVLSVEFAPNFCMWLFVLMLHCYLGIQCYVCLYALLFDNLL